MQLEIQMHLLSDAIFGNGLSMPGGEDICVQTDSDGFPYLKGSTLKGIFREELINYLNWMQMPEKGIADTVQILLGSAGLYEDNERKLVFSDLIMHPEVKKRILEEEVTAEEVQMIFTYFRTFTGLENGTVKEGTLRTARCIKKNLNFYGICRCSEEDEELVKDVFSMIKRTGTMRSRGFGKVEMKVSELHV